MGAGRPKGEQVCHFYFPPKAALTMFTGVRRRIRTFCIHSNRPKTFDRHDGEEAHLEAAQSER
jgi:hypothetical protein